MADEDVGVETAGEFAQFAEESGLMNWLMDSAPDEAPAAEESADTGDATPERPRDEKGRFVAAETEDEPEAPAEEAEQTEQVEPQAGEELTEEQREEMILELDEDVESALQRYDGDINKALRALAEKEKMVGRQANEVGELRQELAQLRDVMQQGFQSMPRYAGAYQNDVDENPQALLFEALDRGDSHTAAVALKAWGEEDPFAATTFLMSQQSQVSQAPVQPAPPQYEGSVDVESAMAGVVERHPDVEQYLPALGETAKEFPSLRAFMEQGNPAQQAQAFEELLVITKSRHQGDTSREAIKKVVLKTQEEVRKEKADAAVVSAQTQTAATPKDDRELRLDQFYEAFDEAANQFTGEWITTSSE